jgi:chemotaxis protein histidine kinase CheA/ActR/RegA family two-component response regulator
VSELDGEFQAELLDIFRDEGALRLDQMDTALLAIEAGDAGVEAIDSLFRNAHTIKGSAAMLGFDDIRALGHAVEDVLASVRDAGVFPPELAAPLLRATAALRAQVAGADEPIDDLLDDLAASRATRPEGDFRAPEASASEAKAAPEADVPEAATAVAATSAAATPEAATSAAATPEAATSAAATSAAATSAAATSAAATSEAATSEAAMSEAATSAAATSAAAMSEAAKSEAATSEEGASEAYAPEEGASGRRAADGADKGNTRGPGPESHRRAAERRTLRVPAEKIDHLLDVVGEVMQNRRRLAHSLGTETQLSQDITDVLGASDRMLDELKETAVGMRTLPLAAITGSLPRAIRDLAHAAGKVVELVVTGAETELDRLILESLTEPLAHLLRNAVNHGIESPAERERAGKPARGHIEIHAVPRGNLVEIVVADDGRGVSPDVIQAARHEGSLADVLTRAGYSTAEVVTDLAGRGVGLDAVKAYVQGLGGTLEVRSEPGRGMEVILLLPLALALLDVLLFERGGAVYGVPLAVVEEAVTVTETLMLEGRPAVEIRGQALPVADFAALVGARAPPLGARTPALVISVGGRRAIATCDALRGEEEVVVKPLGPLFGGVEGYLGTAILGDGHIALLVEPSMLTRRPRRAAGMAPLAAGPVVAGPVVAGPVAPKVLVVEDSFTVRELQRCILEAAGYPVVTAHDGSDALLALDRDAEIALVITDLDMPELNGLELTRAIRANTIRSSLPVVIVTSRGSEDDRRRGMEAGADAYMAKQSFDQQALLATVERLVGR